MRRWWNRGPGWTFAVIACATLPLTCAPAPVTPSGTDVVTFRTQVSALSSGLSVVLDEDASTGLVGAVLVVGAGSSADPPGEEGLAHLVEHLAFRSRDAGGRSIWWQLSRLGAVAWNGETSHEATKYYAFVSRDRVGELLALLSRIADDPLRGVDQAMLDRERAVVRNELRLSQENGAPGEAVAWLDRAVFPPGHPYNRPVIGTHESLSRIGLDDARRFVAQNYRAPRMTLLVTGSAAELARVVPSLSPRLRGDGIPGRVLPEPKLPAALPPPPRVARGPLGEQASAIHSPEVWIAWSLPSIYGPDGAAVELVGLFARGFPTAELRRNHSDAILASVALWPDVRASVLVCRVMLQRGSDPEGAARVAIQLIRDSLKSSAGRDVFVHARETFLTAMAFDTEDVLDRSGSMADWIHLTYDTQYFRRRVHAFYAADPSATARLGLEYVTAENAHVLFVKPLPDAARAAGASLREKSVADEERLSIGRIERRTLLGAAMSPGLSHAVRSRLDNGLELVIVPRRDSPFRTALLGFHGGEVAGGPPGAVEVAARFSGDTVTVPLEMHGIATEHLERLDASYEAVRSSSAELDTVLHVLYERRIRIISGWPTSAFEHQELPLLEQQERAPENAALRNFHLAFVPERAYEPLGAEIAAVTNGQVRERMQAFRRPENAVLVVVGDEDPAHVQARAEASFGRWIGTVRKPATVQVPPRERIDLPPDQRIIVAHRPGATQTELRVGCLLPPMRTDRSALYDVFGDVLQMRLLQELRWKSGLTYDVMSDVSSTADGGTWASVRSDVDNSRLAEALAIVRQQWQSMTPTDDEIDTVLWGRVRAYNLRFRTSASTASELYAAWNRGWSFETLDDYPNALASVVARDLEPLQARCRDNTVLLLIGDEPTIRSALATSR